MSSENTTCPTCGRDDFKSENGMKVHHNLVHDESLSVVERECDECGETFECKQSQPGRFCSYDCLYESRRDQTELECPCCGDTFHVDPSDADRRKYCSYECRSDHGTEKRHCKMCGRGYSVNKSAKKAFCCHECHRESVVERPRPDDDEMLVWLLFVYEGHTRKETFRRARAVRGYDDRLYRKEVDEIINENGWEKKNRLASKVKGLHENDNTIPEGDDSWKQLHSD